MPTEEERAAAEKAEADKKKAAALKAAEDKRKADEAAALKAKKPERFPIKRGSVTVFRTREEAEDMGPGWKFVK